MSQKGGFFVSAWIWPVVIALTALLAALVIAVTRRTAFSTRKLVLLSALTAVYVVLSMVGTLNLWWIRISVDSLPIILGALLYGPAGGLLVGLVGSFLGQLLSYGLTATTGLWIAPAAVRGALIGLYAQKKGYRLTTPQLIGVLCVTALIVTALNTLTMYLDSVAYGYYSFAYVFGGLLTRFAAGLATALVMAFIAPPVVGLLDRTLESARDRD